MAFDLLSPMQRYPEGPSAGELRAILEREIELRSPDFYKSKLIVEFERQSVEDSKKVGPERRDYHQVIFTVPYRSETQPIELVWGHCKRWVRQHYEPNRSVNTVRKLLHEGLYGAPGHAPLDAALCSRMINHTWKEMNSIMEQLNKRYGDLIQGNIGALTINWGKLADADDDTQAVTAEQEVVDEPEDIPSDAENEPAEPTA